MATQPTPEALVLFDGVCNVCDNFVNFIIDRDSNGKILFSSQQSEIGDKIMKDRNIITNLDTMVLLHKDKIYTHSSAFIRTVGLLGGIYSLILLFLIIPAFFRDFCYSLFAKIRYRLFGKKEESCRIMTKDRKKRFLQFNTNAANSFTQFSKTT